MKTKLLAATAASVLLMAAHAHAACTDCKNKADYKAKAEHKSETMAKHGHHHGDKNITMGKPALGTWGVDLGSKNPEVKPGDDFFMHANGTWVEKTEIPSDKSYWGSFYKLRDLSEERVKTIIDDAATGQLDSEGADKIGALYNAFMNTDLIEDKGLAPFKSDLRDIANIDSYAELSEAFGESGKRGWDSPIGGYIWADMKDPDSYAVYLSQSGLGMPNRDYYLKDGEKYDGFRQAYINYINTMMHYAGFENPGDHALEIYKLERKIAEAHWPPEKQRDPVATYNPMTTAELQSFAPGIDWQAMLDAGDVGHLKQFVVSEKSAFPKLAEIVKDTPLSTWRSYLAFHYMASNASVMPKVFDDATFAFYGKTLKGQPEQRARWKRAVSAVEQGLGEAVGEIYVARHFPPEAKEKMDALVANLMKAYEVRIKGLDWMGADTKKAALKKLSTFTPKIAYPENWRDYDDLMVRADDAAGNAMRVRRNNYAYEVAKLDGPVDDKEWHMTPQTVNAYYNPTANEIVFPAAILQPPFFDPYADPAVNYGGIGAVIGHEISHGFDDSGSQFDEEGRLRDWWTKADRVAFDKKAKELVAQYASFEAVPGLYVNGELTLGENIADLAGLTVAYHAYQMSLNGKEAPVIDGKSGDQRFFMGWAQVWQSKYREDALRERTLTDPHSPAMFRVNGVVRNMDAWYQAFDVKKDQALYLPTEKRIRLW